MLIWHDLPAPFHSNKLLLRLFLASIAFVRSNSPRFNTPLTVYLVSASSMPFIRRRLQLHVFAHAPLFTKACQTTTISRQRFCDAPKWYYRLRHIEAAIPKQCPASPPTVDASDHLHRDAACVGALLHHMIILVFTNRAFASISQASQHRGRLNIAAASTSQPPQYRSRLNIASISALQSSQYR
jgi:hypothetical protein